MILQLKPFDLELTVEMQNRGKTACFFTAGNLGRLL